jgi:hypothetical protein
MPAISPARLKNDIAALFEVVSDAVDFDRAMEALLDRYADRTYRKSQGGSPGSLLPAYHAPLQVLRQVEHRLGEYAADHPEAALEIADRLWSWESFEPKFMAVRILGSLPEGFGERVMKRIGKWIMFVEDDELQAELVKVGLALDEARLLAMVEVLLEDGGTGYRAALSALDAVARTASAEALPGVYRMFGKALALPGADSNARLVSLARGLANRSPVETAHFLRHQYLLAVRPEVARILRQVLPLFPDQLQKDIRRLMRESNA